IFPNDDEKLLLDNNKFEIIGQVYKWYDANESLVRLCGTWQSTFRLLRLENPDSPDKPTILSTDAAVILKARFLKDSLPMKPKKYHSPQLPQISLLSCVRQAIPPISSSKNDTLGERRCRRGSLHRLNYNSPEVRIYTFNPDTNRTIWRSLVKPDQVESDVLRGFVLDMQEIY
ncbi:30381_t:CDS:2, partial [Racocetra persica]